MDFRDQCIRWLVKNYKGNAPYDCAKKHILKSKNDIKTLLLPRAAHFDYAKEGFSPQSDAHHMNSSQTFCINLFEPLRKSRKDVLKALLSVWGISLKGDVVKTEYEKMMSAVENTHFDFYIETDICERVFIEVKYTEAEFGKNPNWNDEDSRITFYKKWMSYSRNLKGLREAGNASDLRNRYQLLRNISYVRSDSDFVLFLFPGSSKTLVGEYNAVCDYLGASRMKNVYKADAEKLVVDITAAIGIAGRPSPKLAAHYRQLDSMYFGWLHD